MTLVFSFMTQISVMIKVKDATPNIQASPLVATSSEKKSDKTN